MHIKKYRYIGVSVNIYFLKMVLNIFSYSKCKYLYNFGINSIAGTPNNTQNMIKDAGIYHNVDQAYDIRHVNSYHGCLS
jgi:hypothetical protein